jgi:PAS domain S-box-containing protein
MQPKKYSKISAIFIAFLYFLIGILWIHFSDSAVNIIASTTNEFKLLQTYKGFFYVFTTSVLLYFLVLRFLHTQVKEYNTYFDALETKFELEKSLKNMNEMYYDIFDNMLDSVAHCRMIFENGKPVDYEYINVNKIFESTTGLHDVIGRKISEFIPQYAQENPDSLHIFGEVASTGKPCKWEHYLKALDQWYNFSIYSPKYGEFIVISANVTSEKKALQSVKEKEVFLDRTSHIAKIGGWSFDVPTLQGEWTDELIRIHDLPPDAFIDVNKGLEYYTPQSRPIIEKAVQDIISFGKPFDLELEIISAKGIHKWIRTVAEPVIVDAKVTKVHGVMQDITELKHSKIASQQNMYKYQLLFENSLDALMTFSLSSGKFSNPNQATLKLFGAQNEADFLAIGPANVSPLFQPDGRASDEKSREMIEIALRDGSNFFEWQHKRLNGEIFDADVLLTRLNLDGEEPFIQATVRDVSERKHSEEKIINYLKKLKSAMKGTLLAISKMVEQRDPYTAGHEQRVGLIAAAIACEIGYPEDKCTELQEIGLAHDIGKISIPAEILSKPTKLTMLEYELIKTHSEKGYEILKNIEFPFPIAEIIYQHHERMDGSGYPRALKGDEILPEARILAVADVIEAMASHRPYRASLGIDQALEEIERGRGTSYDADVVDATLHLFREKNYSIPMQEL